MNPLEQMIAAATVPQNAMQRPALPPAAIGPTSLAHLFRLPGAAAGVHTAAMTGDQAPFDAALQRSLMNATHGAPR